MRGRCLASGLLLVSLAPGLQLQVSPPTRAPEGRERRATLTGTVTAADRAVLPDVVLVITNSASGPKRTIATAGHGTYTASGLEPGAYVVRAELPGFEPQAREIQLTEGSVARLDFTLELASHSEGVEVVGAVPVDRFEVTDRTETGARDVGEALARLGGVTLLRKGGIANDIVLGGYQGENLNVLIDGARLHGACPNNMDPAAAHVDLSEVARVEIGKGPFDVTNQGSLGGVVNIVTARPAKGLHGQVDLAAGSSGFVNPAFTASLGGSRTSMLAGLSFRTADPYFDGAGRPFTAYANYRAAAEVSRAFDAITGWGRTYLRLGTKDSLHVSFARQDLDHVLYPYLLMDGISDTADRATAAYERPRTAGFEALALTVYASRIRHFMSDEFRVSSIGTAGYSMGTDASTLTSGGTIRLTRGAATVGGEWYRRQWEATTRFARAGYVPQYALPDVVQLTGGAYGEFAREVRELTIEAGGRIDRTSSAADATRANVSLYRAYHLTQSTSRADTYLSGKLRISRMFGRVRVTAGVGHSARPPDPQERYYALARQGSDWVGNPALPVIHNTGVRVDASFRGPRLVIDGAVQYDAATNFITPYAQVRQAAVPGVVNTSARSFADVNARIGTIESRGSYMFSSRWFGTLSTIYTRGRKTPDPARGIASGNLPEIPPFRMEMTLRHDRGRVFGEAALSMNARQSHIDTDVGERATPESGVLSIKTGVRLKHVRAAISVQNVLDRWYYNHLSFQRDPFRSGAVVWEPGRTVHANVAFTW